MESGDGMVTDLLRSAWIVHAAREVVYSSWAAADERFAASARRARASAEVLREALSDRSRGTDRPVVAPHAEWITSLVRSGPVETPFADIFLARLGDWVEAHAGHFLAERPTLKELAEQEHEGLTFPESLPPPPPFEPVSAPPVEAPGEVLFRFAILGDLHVGSRRGDVMARAAIADINASGAELVVQLGDITDRGNRDEFDRAVNILNELAMPFATMMGNHDVYSYQEERIAGRELYGTSFGREPDGVMLEHEGFRFAVLDSAEHQTSPFAPFNLVTGQFMEGTGGAIVSGALTTPQHEILAEVAARGAPPAFVFLHHPPQPFTSFPPIIFGLRDADSGRLHATCDSGNVWGVFAGHTHRNKKKRSFDGVPVQEVGIPRDFPFGYALVEVASEGYAYRFVQLSDEELVRDAYPSASLIHRRYARGEDSDLAWVWTAPA